jgi:hypothetical protein
VTIRRLLVLACLVGMPKMAEAQFTTFIPPKNKVADSVKAAVVAEQKAQQDSLSHVQVTNMKTWVDSAAGLTAVPMTAADSVAQGVTATDSTAFRNGSRAPATASDLPAMVLMGIAALLLGAFLLGDAKESPAVARVKRD